MPVIQASLQDLARRGHEIQRLLRPISKVDTGPAYQHKASTTTFRIATHNGSPPTSDYRAWRFDTVVPGYQGNYFEIWQQLSEERRELWCLHKAYLTIHEIVDRHARAEKEFLCLHCDPNESDGQPHADYKKGPHLHISVAPEPLCRAHIALDGGYLTNILQSVESLTNALQWAIYMLRQEIFDAL